MPDGISGKGFVTKIPIKRSKKRSVLHFSVSVENEDPTPNSDFVHDCLTDREDQLVFHPARLKSGLQSIAHKQALIIISEDRDQIYAGETDRIHLPAGLPA